MYKVVILNQPRVASNFLRTIDSKPASFFAQHVKTLCLARGVTVEQAMRIMAVCTGVSNLACWCIPQEYSAALLPLITKLALRRLSLTHKALPGSDKPEEHGFDLPAFQNITHLDIVNHWSLWNTAGFDALPRLTHIAFRFWARGSVARALRNILTSCTSLKVLVLLTHDLIMDAAVEFLEREGLDDPRIAVVPYSKNIQYYEALGRGEPDLWAAAEENVTKQLVRVPSSKFIASTNPQ